METRNYYLQLSEALRKNYILICLLILLAGKGHAQYRNAEKYQAGTGISTYLTTNGHGTFYSAYLALSKGRSMVTLGPSFQKRSSEIKGARLSFAFLLAGRPEEDMTEPTFNEVETGVLQLKFISYVQYLDQASLSYNRAKVETITNREMQLDWNTVKLSTAEAGLGIEIDAKLKYFTLRNFLTLSVYHHINYIEGMYQERTAPALTIGTGILIPKF
jgi:hypothetical protein